MNKKVMGAIIGLVKTAESNPKTENTDSLIIQALSDCDNEDWIEKLHQEKYTISPGCQTCKSPCGNTDDYDLEEMDEDVQEIKESLLNFALTFAKDESAFNLIQQVLCFVGYDLEPKYFSNIMKQIQAFEKEKS